MVYHRQTRLPPIPAIYPSAETIADRKAHRRARHLHARQYTAQRLLLHRAKYDEEGVEDGQVAT